MIPFIQCSSAALLGRTPSHVTWAKFQFHRLTLEYVHRNAAGVRVRRGTRVVAPMPDRGILDGQDAGLVPVRGHRDAVFKVIIHHPCVVVPGGNGRARGDMVSWLFFSPSSHNNNLTKTLTKRHTEDSPWPASIYTRAGALILRLYAVQVLL